MSCAAIWWHGGWSWAQRGEAEGKVSKVLIPVYRWNLAEPMSRGAPRARRARYSRG